VYVAVAATLTLVAALAITAGYLALADRGGSGSAAVISAPPSPSESPSESPSPEPEPEPEPTPEYDPDEFAIPAGYMGVRTVGALTRVPDGFVEFAGPADATTIAVDAHVYHHQTQDGWHSVVFVGVLDANGVLYDPDDLEGTAEAALDAWANSSAFSSVSGLTVTPVDTALIPIDGKTGALTSALLTWDDAANTADESEAVQLLLVGIDRTTAWVGVVSVTDSHFDSHYEAGAFALINTTFAA
jgi:hypothetical protein